MTKINWSRHWAHYVVILVMTVLALMGPGVKYLDITQGDREAVDALEYQVILAVEETDPTIYVWYVEGAGDAVTMWITWNFPAVEEGLTEAEAEVANKATLIAFLNAALVPLRDFYPEKSAYYIITCEVIAADNIESDGHLLKGEMIWNFSNEAVQTITEGITYDELEQLGADGQLDLQPAWVYSQSGIFSHKVTQRTHDHVRPW